MTRQESTDKIRASNTLPNDKSADDFKSSGLKGNGMVIFNDPPTDNSASLEKPEPPK